jgi:hypothetical protein
VVISVKSEQIIALKIEKKSGRICTVNINDLVRLLVLWVFNRLNTKSERIAREQNLAKYAASV